MPKVLLGFLLVLAFAGCEDLKGSGPRDGGEMDGSKDVASTEAGGSVDSPTGVDTAPPDRAADHGATVDVGVCGSGCNSKAKDGCCPSGCTAVTDADCLPKCGNTVIEAGEECDPPGSCPASCPNQGCTKFQLEGSAAACTAKCVAGPMIGTCINDDKCCPAVCNTNDDSDCKVATCGNTAIETGETCDPLSTCPTTCPPNQCQLRKLINAGTCAAACVDDRKQTTCTSGDGCCPAGGVCNNNEDSDCPAICGNSVKESGETCEPLSVCAARSNACVSDKDVVRTRSGDASNCTFVCTETARPCGPADDACPTGCAPSSSDTDCKLALGTLCTSGTECLSGSCVDSRCCSVSSCGTCSACNVSGHLGSCFPKPSGSADGACPLDASRCIAGGCDGNGGCKAATAGTQCGAATCINSDELQYSGQWTKTSSTKYLCDGLGSSSGSCKKTTVTCGSSLVCAKNGTTCNTSCSLDSDCVAGWFCASDSGQCVQRIDIGFSCKSDHECNSRVCLKGTCRDCNTDDDCPVAAPICYSGDGAPPRCVKCDLPSDPPYCHPGGEYHCGNFTTLCTHSTRAPSCSATGYCHCAEVTDCPRGAVCTSQGCKILGGGPCVVDSDCIHGVCVGGVCPLSVDRDPCRSVGRTGGDTGCAVGRDCSRCGNTTLLTNFYCDLTENFQKCQ